MNKIRIIQDMNKTQIRHEYDPPTWEIELEQAFKKVVKQAGTFVLCGSRICGINWRVFCSIVIKQINRVEGGTITGG